MNLQAKKQPYEETRKGSQSIVGGQPRQDGLPVGHSENWGAKAAHTHEKWDRGSYLDPLKLGKLGHKDFMAPERSVHVLLNNRKVLGRFAGLDLGCFEGAALMSSFDAGGASDPPQGIPRPLSTVVFCIH